MSDLPYQLEIWAKPAGGDISRIFKESRATNFPDAIRQAIMWTVKEDRYRVQIWHHTSSNPKDRVWVGTLDRGGLLDSGRPLGNSVATPENVAVMSQHDLGQFIGEILKNAGDGAGDLIGAMLQNQSNALDGIGEVGSAAGEAAGQILAGIFEGLGSG